MTRAYSEVAGKFVGKPFHELGYGQPGIEGYNCYGLCRTFFKAFGKQWVTEMGGRTLLDWLEYMKQDTTKTREQHNADLLIMVCDMIGREIRPNEAVAGDFVLVRTEKDESFAAVYAGNNQIMASFYPMGVRVVKCGKDFKIVKARRLE